jgi:YD repeat-containing protein
VYSVTKIELTPENPVNRVTPDAIRVFTSLTNYPNEYTETEEFIAEYVEKNEDMVLRIVLDEPVDVRYLKIKTNFDDREMEDFIPRNKAEFKNDVDKIIKVYYNVDSRNEEYAYDDLGNRTKETVTLKDTEVKEYRYYPGTSRLMTDGRWAYVYDANGNVVRKGNTVVVEGEAVKVREVEETYWV